MPVRYYLFAESAEVLKLRETLIEKGFPYHKGGEVVLEHFHIDEVLFYPGTRINGSIVRSMMEFPGDEEDLNKLEEIIAMADFKKVVDTFWREYKKKV
jgi:hypothetical protein